MYVPWLIREMGFLPTSSLSQEIRNSKNDINYYERYLLPGRRRDFRLRATALQQLSNPRLCLSHATLKVAHDTACRARLLFNPRLCLSHATLKVAHDTACRARLLFNPRLCLSHATHEVARDTACRARLLCNPRLCLSCATALQPQTLLIARDCSATPDSACRARHPKSSATQNVAHDKTPQRMTPNAAGGSVETPSNSNPLIGSRVLPLT
jgi:hypothetical protein